MLLLTERQTGEAWEPSASDALPVTAENCIPKCLHLALGGYSGADKRPAGCRVSALGTETVAGVALLATRSAGAHFGSSSGA
jgi:hypothetical protein